MRWLAAVLLVVAVLAPYHEVVTGRAIPIPDDIFVSDLADGEFPARVEAGAFCGTARCRSGRRAR